MKPGEAEVYGERYVPPQHRVRGTCPLCGEGYEDDYEDDRPPVMDPRDPGTVICDMDGFARLTAMALEGEPILATPKPPLYLTKGVDRTAIEELGLPLQNKELMDAYRERARQWTWHDRRRMFPVLGTEQWALIFGHDAPELDPSSPRYIEPSPPTDTGVSA